MFIEVIKSGLDTHYRAVIRINRKKVSKTFPRKQDAESWWGIMKARQKGLLPEKAQKSSECTTKDKQVLTLNNLMQRFDESHSSLYNAPATRKMNWSLYRMYVAQPFGERLAKEISDGEIRSYFSSLRPDLSNDRINRIRQLLNVVFNEAIRRKDLMANPVCSIRKLDGTDYFSGESIRYLTAEESERLLSWIRANDKWLYAKVVVLLYSGIRYGEMIALRRSDLRSNLKTPHLSISRSRCRHTGTFLPPKGKRSRMIPLSNGLVSFLEPLVEGKKPDDPLLLRDWKEGRWPTKMEDHFKKATREAKVSQVRIHDLRHTFAVRFIENGGHLYILKEILGHSTMKLTMRYSHFSPAMAEQAREIVSFKPPRPNLAVVDGGLL